MAAKSIAKEHCSWNYFYYRIVEVLGNDEVLPYEDFGEDLLSAKNRLKALRKVLPERKFFIQEEHFVSHII